MAAVLKREMGSAVTVAWLVLVLATASSLVLGLGPTTSQAAGTIIIAAAFFKAWVVGEYFMETRHAPAVVRWLLAGYCLLLGAAMIGLLLVS